MFVVVLPHTHTHTLTLSPFSPLFALHPVPSQTSEDAGVDIRSLTETLLGSEVPVEMANDLLQLIVASDALGSDPRSDPFGPFLTALEALVRLPHTSHDYDCTAIFLSHKMLQDQSVDLVRRLRAELPSESG